MGDIADAMLDGTLCMQCGAFLDSEEEFAQMCTACEDDYLYEGEEGETE